LNNYSFLLSKHFCSAPFSSDLPLWYYSIESAQKEVTNSIYLFLYRKHKTGEKYHLKKLPPTLQRKWALHFKEIFKESINQRS